MRMGLGSVGGRDMKIPSTGTCFAVYFPSLLALSPLLCRALLVLGILIDDGALEASCLSSCWGLT